MRFLTKILKWTLAVIALLIVIQMLLFWHATTSPQWKYTRKTFSCYKANFDLRYCVDLPAESRKDFTHTNWKPMPCINTATQKYLLDYRTKSIDC